MQWLGCGDRCEDAGEVTESLVVAVSERGEWRICGRIFQSLHNVVYPRKNKVG